MDLAILAAFCALLVLLACANLFAHTVSISDTPPTTQENPGWRLLSDVAAAAAAAVAQGVCPEPPPGTAQVIHVAARAATAATATALGGDLLGLSGVPWAPLAPQGAAAHSAGAVGGRRAVRSCRGRGAALRRDGGGGGVRDGAHGLGVAAGGVWRQGSSERRKPRTSISLDKTIQLIDIKEDGHTWAETLAIFPLRISPSAARAIYRSRGDYKRRAAAAQDLLAPRL